VSPRRPVPLSRVAVGALLFVLAVGAQILLAESLRHPPPLQPALAEPDDGDPRVQVECPGPEPREGVDRDDLGTERLPPVEVTSNDLYDCPETFDGEHVRFRGEVVGGVLRRDDGSWTQLNDDVYADALGPLPAHRDFRGGNAGAGVFLPPDLAARIAHVGGPRSRGDVLEVDGVFLRVDPSTREVAVIRARTGRIVQGGGPIDDPLLRDRQLAAVLLTGVALSLVGYQVLRSRRARGAGGLASR
jgi:hypothetical protein